MSYHGQLLKTDQSNKKFTLVVMYLCKSLLEVNNRRIKQTSDKQKTMIYSFYTFYVIAHWDYNYQRFIAPANLKVQAKCIINPLLQLHKLTVQFLNLYL